MRRPDTIKNEALWIVQCTKIRARALDLLEGRLGMFEAASALSKLAALTHAREDRDLAQFGLIYGEFLGLPAGSERAYWSPSALLREDIKIRAVEACWRDQALLAASNLVTRYAWSIDARTALRRAGGGERDV